MKGAHRFTSRTIVGREEPLRALDGLLTAAIAGEPHLIVLAGEAGVGKTRLATALEQQARDQGALVLHGECVEMGGEALPYAPVIAALRDLPEPWVADALEELDAEARAELAVLLPRVRIADAARPAGATSWRFGQARLCELMLHLLASAARELRPLLVVLEDMHWADRSSWDLVAYLGRNLRDERIAVALTFRSGELAAGHPLRRLLAELAPPARRHEARSRAARSRGGRAPARRDRGGARTGAARRASCTPARAATRSWSRSSSPPTAAEPTAFRRRSRTPCRRGSPGCRPARRSC